MNKIFLLICTIIFAITTIFMGCTDIQEYGTPYLGQEFPGISAELFAPGIVSTGLEESVIAFTPNGKECYWSVSILGIETILCSKLENHKWSKPEVASFSGKYHDGWPSIQPDGKRMFFHSGRPYTDSTLGVTAEFNIWYMDKKENGWGEPIMLPPPVNGSETSSCPTITKDQTLYFSKWHNDREDLVRSRFVNGKYQELEVLPNTVNAVQYNFHGAISPDETYIVRPLNGRDDAIGGPWNYYVSFRDGNDNWSELINLGESVNNLQCGGSLSFTSDGKYLFFQARVSQKGTLVLDKKLTLKEMLEKAQQTPEKGKSDIYWISTKIIEGLKPSGL